MKSFAIGDLVKRTSGSGDALRQLGTIGEIVSYEGEGIYWVKVIGNCKGEHFGKMSYWNAKKICKWDGKIEDCHLIIPAKRNLGRETKLEDLL